MAPLPHTPGPNDIAASTLPAQHADGAPADHQTRQLFNRCYVQILLLIINSASWVANLGADWLQIAVLGFAILFAATGVPINAVSKRLVFAWFFLTVSILVVAILRSGVPTNSDILFFIAIFVAALAASSVQGQTEIAIQAFVRLMFHLCVISLILFPLVFVAKGLLVPVPDALQQFFTDTINSNRRFYTFFGLSYFATNHGLDDIWRNQSIFWEPGMLGLFSVLALALSDVVGASRKYKHVFVAAALSTFAPGTYALLIIYLGLRILRVSQMGVVMSGLTIALFASLAAGSIPLLREIALFLFDRDIYNDNSIFVRFTDFWLPYVVALDAPLLGFTTILPYQDAMQIAIERRMNGMTNSVGAYFYRYGYVWAVAFILWTGAMFARAGPQFGGIPYVMFVGVMYEPVGFSSVFLYLIFLMASASQMRVRP